VPIIRIEFIKDVVANDAQKLELIQKMTDTFISVVGEVARPYVYCIIQEAPQMQWGIGGKPMPDLGFLIGPEYAGMHARANAIMSDVVAQMQAGNAPPSDEAADKRAEDVWKA
jgi:4-oxalocrotonate tautomerase